MINCCFYMFCLAADPQLTTLLVQLLLLFHSLRRLQECLFVSVFSNGSMHLVQYLFGLVYYVILGLTALGSDREGEGETLTQRLLCMSIYSFFYIIFIMVLLLGTGPLLSQLEWFHVVGGVVFIMASLMQHQCLVHLAGLRLGKSGKLKQLSYFLDFSCCTK